MITPVHIGYYWQNPAPIPAWRQRCADRLVELYPFAEVIRHDVVGPYPTHKLSNAWRMAMAGRYKRFLWVDSDIYLDSPLELTERPAMADEYGIRHWSIVWSGDNPDIYYNHEAEGFISDTRIELLKITGTHWATGADGSKVARKY